MPYPITSPVLQPPNINLWKGIMSLNWTYNIPESMWDNGWSWDESADGYISIQDENFTDSAFNFGFDFQYDLNNDGNWVTGTMIGGVAGSNHDVDVAPAWNVLSTYWDLGLDISEDSSNCKVRTRLYNRRLDLWSNWGYYGPVAVETIYTVIFMKHISNQTYYWLPSVPPDFATPILDKLMGTSHSNSVTGGRTSVRSRPHVQTFSLHWNVIPLEDVDAYKEFLKKIDYKRLPFIYKCKELNHEAPFGGTWKSNNVKFDQLIIPRQHVRGNYHNLKINLRKTVETP